MGHSRRWRQPGLFESELCDLGPRVGPVVGPECAAATAGGTTQGADRQRRAGPFRAHQGQGEDGGRRRGDYARHARDRDPGAHTGPHLAGAGRRPRDQRGRPTRQCPPRPGCRHEFVLEYVGSEYGGGSVNETGRFRSRCQYSVLLSRNARYDVGPSVRFSR